MTTAIQGAYVPFTCTNLTQTLNYSEGAYSLSLAQMILSTSVNYSRVYTLTMTLSSFAQASAVAIISSNLNGIPFTRVGNVYTISSEYVDSKGVKINNWAYFKLAISSMYLSFNNSDFSTSFTISNSITDGTTTLTGTTSINTSSIADVTGNNQTVTVGMAMNGQSLTTVGGTNIAINDPAQAGKTYRVTVTPVDATNASGTSDMTISRSGLWSTPYVVSGTQAYINSQLASSGNNTGLNFNQYNPNFYGTTAVSYLQEVLTTTEPGVTVPYTQETGTLTFNTTYTAPFAIGSNPTYVEDGSVTFSLGSITDPAGTNYAHETCGVYQGYNCYTITATVAGSFSGSNPVVLTYAGDVSLNNSITFTGSKTACNSFLSSVTLIPPADHTGNLVINITVTRGNTPVTIYTGSMTATCSSSHADFTIISGTPFVLGANTVNFGSITDLATSKNYTVTIDATAYLSSTRGNLSDPTGLGVWNATGGVNSFGRMTITGTKTQVNDSLDGLVYTTVGGATTSDTQAFAYTQTQNTNSVAQGTKNISIANDIMWGSGNGIHSGQNAFVYDQDVATTWNLATLGGNIDTSTTYTAKLVFSTPLSVANLGSVTGWTRETDYIWTLTGVRTTLNAALAALVLVPPAQLVSNFTLDIKVYNGATLIADTSALGSTKTIYINQLVNNTWTASALTYDQDASVTWSNLATLNSNFGSGTYTLRLITNIATGASITGWTVINSTTFEKTDTKANLQTALNSLTFVSNLSFVSNFTFNLEAYRSSLLLYTSATLSNSKAISVGVVYSIAVTGSALTFDQDVTTTFNFATLSSNFNNGSTYTITLTSSVASIGVLTGWTTASTTTFTKTDTGANLITALGALQFVPVISLTSGFTLTASAVKSATTIATSSAKTISIGVVYQINLAGTDFMGYPSFQYSFEAAETVSPFATLSSNFQNGVTYTIEMFTGGAGPLVEELIGTFSGWTRTTGVFVQDGSDTVTFTKTDTKENLVTALASIEYISAAGCNRDLGFTIRAYNAGGARLTPENNFFYLTIQNPATVTYAFSGIATYRPGEAANYSPFINADGFGSTTIYTAVLKFTDAYFNTYYNEWRSTGYYYSINIGTISGWTYVNTIGYTKTGTGVALAAALDNIQFTTLTGYYDGYTVGDGFVITVSTVLGSSYNGVIGVARTELPRQFMVNDYVITPTGFYEYSPELIGLHTYVPGVVEVWPLATLSAAFDPTTTYTAEISLGSVAGFAITGWTLVSANRWQITDTGANISAVLSGIETTTNSNATQDTTLTLTISYAGQKLASARTAFHR